MPSKTDDKYTDPELREQVKEEMQAGDKGGAPGQWTARKAQMMALEYKKRGGGYTTDKQDDQAKHLDEWTKEEWQTKEGNGKAKDEDGTEHRYLPKKAWEKMDEQEKEATDEKKQQASQAGQQRAANTAKAAQARKAASKHDKDDANESKGYTKIERKSVTDCTTHWDDPEYMEDNARAFRKFREEEQEQEQEQEQERRRQGTSQQEHGGKKRGRGANAGCPNKKAKSGGDKTRVPQKGQQVQWHAQPGYADGQVVEVVYEEKEVEGQRVKASNEEPRVVLRSEASGQICVHKPEAVYFD